LQTINGYLGIVKTINSGFAFVSKYFTPACSSGQAETAKGKIAKIAKEELYGDLFFAGFA
jgi:hypothetical protein